MRENKKVQIKSVTVIGGAGFLGRYIVQKLAANDIRITVAVRNPDSAEFLKTMSDVGTIKIVKINILNEKSIKDAIKDSDAVINCVGTLKTKAFDNTHVKGSELIAKAVSSLNIKRFVHISAVGADKNSNSKYAVTKALGEEKILKNFPNAVILRPSIMFGAEDKFFNKIAGLSRLSLIMPLFGGGKTKFQPVYVGDVANAVTKIGLDPATIKYEYYGKTYELGGPKVYTYKELIELTLKYIGRRRLLLPIPYLFAKLAGMILQYLPNPIITVDQIKLLKYDFIVNKTALGFKNLDITTTSVEMIVPEYLKRYSYNG